MPGILSLAFWVFVGLSSLCLFPIAVLLWAVTAPFDRRLVGLHRFTCFWASLYTWLNPVWRIEIEGREHIEPGQTYVMVSNHQSLLDILVLFRLFTHFKWVSKIENFRVPLIGWNMSLNRYIKLRRGDKGSVLRMLRACQRDLERGNSILFFPEGTRSRDGKLRSFKTGAFEIARQARVPILPVILDGTGNALPRRGFVLRGRHQIRVRVLEAVPHLEYESQSVEEFRDGVRALVARELENSGARELRA